MHSVMRKVQGLPYEPPRPQGMKANLASLVDVSVRPNPEPLPEDTLAVAFDARAYPKLVLEMTGLSLVLRQKSLRYAIEKMTAPKEVASFLEAGIVEALNIAGRDENDEVRALATRAFARVAREPNGRKLLLERNSVSVLKKMVQDTVEDVRANCLEAMLELGRDIKGADSLIEHGCVELLVKRAPQEAAVLQGPTLAAVRIMMMRPSGLTNGIETEGIGTMASMLAAPEASAREHAAWCLAALTVELREKAAARKGEAIGAVVSLLRVERDVATQTAALAALMSLTAENEAKTEAVRTHKVVEVLLPMLERSALLELQGNMNPATCTQTVNLAKCIANLAEEPKGRKQLQPALAQLEPLTESAEPLVRKHAASAVERVTWKP